MHDPKARPSTVPDNAAPQLPPGWLGKWPWVTFILPFAVFMLVGALEPTPPANGVAGPVESAPAADESALAEPMADVAELELSKPLSADEVVESTPGRDGWLPQIPYRYYPAVYTAKIALTLLAMLLVWPGYRTVAWHWSPLAVVVGVVGAIVWVGLCRLNLEPKLLAPLGLERFVDLGARSAFNPLKELAANPGWAYGFLAIRFIGLVVVVPVIEEFFLRGFVARFVTHDQWQHVPFAAVSRTALIAVTVTGMLMHPAELLAAAVWFSLVSWLLLRTRTLWDCVVAHAVTNLLMGVYVVVSGDWRLM